ncbi:MAG: C25 family cysteine peptidase [Acidobacteriota bacterium]
MLLKRSFPVVLALIVACACSHLLADGAAAPGDQPDSPAFKIETQAAGVHRIAFEDLRMEPAFWSSRALRLSHRGNPVPIHLVDGGDGRFGPGDYFEFLAERLGGEDRYHHGWSTHNVYWLRQSREPSPQLVTRRATAATPATPSALRSPAHFEDEKVFLRFPNESQHSTEVWYWQRLSHIDPEPFRTELELPHLARQGDQLIALEVRLRGWSQLADRPRPEEPDHVLDIWLEDRRLLRTSWNNSPRGHQVRLPVELSAEVANGLELRFEVPARPRDPQQPDGDRLVDVAVLDWVHLEYPVDSAVGDPGHRLSHDGGGLVQLRGRPEVELALWPVTGGRVLLPAGGEVFSAAVGESFFATAGDALRPTSVRPAAPPKLRRNQLGADYIIVVHPRLRRAVLPLAEAHRRRGLRVEVVNIERVYDEFGDGIPHPQALRDFLAWAHRRWQRPQPRFVLLVGDASWDTKNDVVLRGNYARAPYAPGRGIILGTNRDQVYADKPFQNRRNLIPTWSYPTLLGHAATDNWFVDVADDDRRPEMAIGRWPVADPEEVEAIVEKTLRQLEAPPLHRAKRDVLWISDGNPILGTTTDRLVRIATSRGFTTKEIRPESSDASPEERRERLLAAFDGQPSLVHFFGHGGRSIWRTGMGEEESRRDLFTLDDLDQLAPRDRLPVLLSMSCYSAPFDHPNVDSIGEKFLRLEDRGAAAVVAASARNSPTFKMSWSLLLEFTRHDTIGEAIVAAKRRSHSRDFIEQYNLLGDPALPTPLPSSQIELREAVTLADARPAVLIDRFGSDSSVLVEWLADDGTVLAEEELPLSGAGAMAVYGEREAPPSSRPTAVRVYAWDRAAGRDGAGHLALSTKASPRRLAAQRSGER